MLPILTLFLGFFVLTNVTLGVTFLFLLEFVIEYFVLSIIITYGFGKYTVLASVAYMIISMVVTIFAALNPIITPKQMAITSLIPSM